MDKKNAWKVEPDLIDRFLDVLADNGFRWMLGHKANKFKDWDDGDTIIFVEETPKTITYEKYSPCLEDPHEEFNLTDVTEEWLRDRENEKVTRYEHFGESSAEEGAVKMIISYAIDNMREYSDSDLETLYRRYKVMKQWLNEVVDAMPAREQDNL